MKLEAAADVLFVNHQECAAWIAEAESKLRSHVGALATASARSWLKDARRAQELRQYERAIMSARRSIAFSERA